MEEFEDKLYRLKNDGRFKNALNLFNSSDWYPAHDAFEELWHETSAPERRTLQGFLQIAVAELHIEKGNFIGATILYGEALGRLKLLDTPDLGIDLQTLCACLDKRLLALQKEQCVEFCPVPTLLKKD